MMLSVIVAAIALGCIQIAESAFGATFYVAMNGKDTNPGTVSEPFLTLNRARDEIRSMKSKGLPNGGVLVSIRGGTYTNNNYSMYNEPVLDLNSINDSGEDGKPIVYGGYQNEKVEIIGGYQVDSSAFVQSTTYPNLLVADLSKLNSALWDNVEYGNLASGSLGTCANNRAELFVNAARMVLARWPNIYTDSKYPGVDIWNFTQINTVKNTNSFTYEFSTERATAWQKEVSSSNVKNSPWVHGYWSFDWADSYTQIQSIDMNTKTITTYNNTPPVYGYKAKARYYGVNLISELDTINEYYLDMINKKVYISKQRQTTLSTDKYYISVNHYPIQVAVSGAKYKWGKRKDFWNDEEYTSRIATPPGKSGLKVTIAKPLSSISPKVSSIEYLRIENITIAYGIQTGLYISACNNCQVNNVRVLGIGELGAMIHGYNNTVSNIIVQHTGCTGLSVEGGDTNSLTRGNNIVQNSNVSYMGEWKRTYQPGYGFGGVGNTWKNNYAGYGPHQGMTGSCNDCLFTQNVFDNLCYESSDSGAWYAGRSWVHRGTIISNNTFINIRNIESTVLGATAVQGVYLDDQLSGHNISGNIFINSYAGIMLGGGRRVEIHNNKFASCLNGVEYDDRGLTWQTSYCQPGGTFNQQLNDVNYKQPPWSTHYTYLPNIFNQQPCTPVYDHITNNEYCCGSVANCKMVTDSSSTCQAWNSTCNHNTQTNWSKDYC